MITSGPLAQAEGIIYEFARLHALSEWWHWLVMIAIGIVIPAIIIPMYRMDCRELPKATAVALVLLRVTAFAGILFYFFDLERKAEQTKVNDSRIICLVDTSQSMAMRDARGKHSPSEPRRIDDVIGLLKSQKFIDKFREKHNVVVYRFDEQPQPTEVASYPRHPRNPEGDDASAMLRRRQERELEESRKTAMVAAVVLGISFLAGVFYLGTRRTRVAKPTSWMLLIAMVTLIASLVILAVANLRHPNIGVMATIGLEEPTFETDETDENKDDAPKIPEVDWSRELNPAGSETRIGEAVKYVVDRERGGPIAGVIIFTDGSQNAGEDAAIATEAAKRARIQVHCVGLGSDKPPVNAKLVDVEAPQRVYPGDDFNLVAYFQAFGMSNTPAKIQVYSHAPTKPGEKPKDETLEDTIDIVLSEDGLVGQQKVTLTPKKEGKRVYRVVIVPTRKENNPNDNQRSANVEVADRKTKVLLFAGGPTREFRFLRNLFFRDKDIELHVHLQSGRPGISQEADELLFSFPDLEDDVFKYDCIIAFDPNWLKLSQKQIDLVERWVAEKAGGLIVVAGPVFTPMWARKRKGHKSADVVKGLYPVRFFGRTAATINTGRVQSDTPWQLRFSPAGAKSQFLWLEDTAIKSEEAWATFDGVYGYFAVKSAKDGATIFARFSDPKTSTSRGNLPIYLAGQHYGAGKVFFQASGEMWRVRAVDDSYFETYYTKLLRWVSEGRLLRNTSRGVLVTEKDKAHLGDRIIVRAMLNDAQHKPLQLPTVQAMLVHPNGSRRPLIMKYNKNAPRPGSYSAAFSALSTGVYRIELKLPNTSNDELLTREVDVQSTRLEMEKPIRNNSLLQKLAESTGGRYFVGVQSSTDQSNVNLTSLIEPNDQESTIAGTPDKQFDQSLMFWLLAGICGVLSLEWLIRRLNKLA